MKPKKEQPKKQISVPETNPVVVTLPSIVESKMRSIEALCYAVKNLSDALVSTNVKVDISNNMFNGAGISVQTE